MKTEELQAIRVAWHELRWVELYRGAPDREAALKDKLVSHIPALLAEVELLGAVVREAEVAGQPAEQVLEEMRKRS